MLEAENRTIFWAWISSAKNCPARIKRTRWKDVRVRKALYQAIDIQSIQRVVLRGLANPRAR